jgi:recombination protein RecT
MTTMTVTDRVRSGAIAFYELMPPGIDGDRVLHGFEMTVARNDKLRKCSYDSLEAAALDCARLGMWPGPEGHMYLVPYGRTCTPIVGYKGLIALMKRAGGVTRVEARLIHDADEFAMMLGTDPRIDHLPAKGDRGPVIGAYAVAWFVDGSVQFEHMSADEIESIRARSKAANSGPWVTDTGEMYRKTVVRRLAKYVSADSALGHAFTLNDRAHGLAPVKRPVTGGPRPRLIDAAARYSEPIGPDEAADIEAAERQEGLL